MGAVAVKIVNSAALNTSTYTDVSLAEFLNGSVITLRCSDNAIALTLSLDDGTTTFLLPAAGVLQLNAVNDTIGVIAASGTPKLQMIGVE